jgi:hexosaminidase
MHFAKGIFLMVGASALLFSINSYSAINVIPKPKTMTLGTGTFTVPSTVLVWGDAKSDTAVMWLEELLRQANKKVTVTADQNSAHFKMEFLANVTDTSIYGKEGYSLVVTTSGVTVAAPTSAGQFYAIQTLRQMLPPEVELRTPAQVPASIVLDAVTITDKPQWPWRSTMVDPARCWIPLDYLYKTADRIALFKLNIFRLHLTDNEGWRLEVPKYPNLMIKGASTQRGGDTPPLPRTPRSACSAQPNSVPAAA